MKKMILFTLALLMTVGVMAQYKTKHMVVPIANRASAIGIPLKVGDFVYIVADSAMYMTKVNLAAAATGTYLTASTSRYAVAKMASGAAALTATTLTAGRTTLTDTISGTVARFTGNVGIGTTDYNKFTVAGTTGNTAIAGTLGVTGASTLTGNVTVGSSKVVVTAASGNTAIAGTLSAVGNVGIGTTDYNKFTVAGTTGNTVIAGTLGVTGVATFTAVPTMSAGVTLTAVSDTTTKTAGKIVYIGGNFYGCNGTYFYKLNN